MEEKTFTYDDLKEYYFKYINRYSLEEESLMWNIKCVDVSIALYLYEYPNDKRIVPPFPEYQNQTFIDLFGSNRNKILDERLKETIKPLNINEFFYNDLKQMIIDKLKSIENKSNLLLIDLCPNYFSIIRKDILNNKEIFNKQGLYENFKEIITFLTDKKQWLVNLNNDNITYNSLAKELMGISKYSRGIIRDWRENPNECKILNMREEWKIENYIHMF